MSGKNPASFVFYESFYEGIRAIHDDKIAYDIYRALAEYGLYGTMPEDIGDVARAFVISFGYQIDIAKDKHAKKVAAGRKGAEVTNRKKRQNPADAGSAEARRTPNDNANANEEDNANNNANNNANDNANPNEKAHADDHAAGGAPALKKNKADKSANNSKPKQKQSSTAPVAQKKPYGEFLNVYLSPEEYGLIMHQFPGDGKERIDRLSQYKQSSGKHYDDDYATLRLWARRDADRDRPKMTYYDRVIAGLEEAAPSPRSPEYAEYTEAKDTAAREQMLDESFQDSIDAIYEQLDREKAGEGA